MFNKKKIKIFTKLLTIFMPVIGLLMLFDSVTAQKQKIDEARMERKAQANNAVSSSEDSPGNESQKWGMYGDVSLFDGSLNYNLPLMTMSGRGDTSYTPTLKIRGRWDVEVYYDDYDNETYYYGTYTGTNEVSSNNYFGRAVTYGPGAVVIKRNSTSSNYTWGTGLTRLYFYGSAGEVIELRDVLTQGKRWNRISGSGFNRNRRFVSNDGSAVTFISDGDIYDSPYCPMSPCYTPNPFASGVLKFPNGTEYRVDNGAVTSIRDRNGNKMQFTYYPGSVIYGVSVPGLLQTATDTHGRSIQFEYNVQDVAPYGKCTRITYNGFGGTPRIVRISSKALINALRSDEVYKEPWELFPESDGPYGNPPHEVISAVWFPDGKNYKFLYNSYGELSRIELPLGAAIDYDHDKGEFGDDGGFIDDDTYSRIFRRVKERRTYRNGNILDKKEIYGFDESECQSGCQDWDIRSTAFVKTYDGQTSSQIGYNKHYFYGITQGVYNGDGSFSDYPAWRIGREYKNEVLDKNANVLKRTEIDWQQRTNVSWWLSNCNFTCSIEQSPAVDPRVTEVRNIDVVNNQAAKNRYGYDEFNNRTDVWTYDFGTGQAGGLLNYVHTDYVKGSYIDNTYTTSPHIRRLPDQTWVSSDEQGSQKLSFTKYEYDNYISDTKHAPLFSRSNVVGHNSVTFNSGYTQRGNVTGLTTYENAQNQTGPVTIYSQYDILGNNIKTIDAKGNFSTADYSDRFGSPDNEARSNTAPGQLNGQNTFGLATSKTNSLGNTVYLQTDYWTGAVVNSEDINGIITKMLYQDPLDRLTQTISAVGTVHEIQTTNVYDDVNKRVEIKKDLYTLNDNLVRSEKYFDTYGRVIETRVYESNGYTATKTEFDVLGREKRRTAPFRPSLNEQPVWTETFYDSLGRVIKVKTADNAEATTAYYKNSVTITDQAGKKRRTVMNAIGQVTRVDEPNNQGELGNFDSPNQPTNYYYSATGSLIRVSQGVQNRYYLYNSIGHLIRVKIPELDANTNLSVYDPLTGNSFWSSASTYDLNGNLLTATDAKNVTTANTYDTANRVTATTYNDGTPGITFTYDDPNIPFSKGKLTRIANGVSTTEYNSFNGLGMILANKQIIDNQEFTTGYKYDLSGNIIEQTYPSGRVVKTSLDTDGALASVKSRKNSQSALRTYASDFVYNAAGAITSLKLGNGLYETAKYNNRLQLTEVGLGTGTTNTNLLKLIYDYGTTDNNGNIKSQTINTGMVTYQQTYQYDPLNRLIQAREVSNSQQNWQQDFGYDIYGNRNQFAQLVGTYQLPINSLTLPQVDPSSNRFSTGQGYEYDLNGNLTKDGDGKQFTFNANDKQVLLKDSNNQVIGQYFYDGTGKRVKKVTASETVVYIYNAINQLIAEYSTVVNTNPKIGYMTKDILGTPRILTDIDKKVVSRHDYMPFGEEIGRSSYGGDAVKLKFTGYERDGESGLDFAQARMYSYNSGRFTGPDQINASLTSPQTFNRYQYCYNNPLRCVDKTGGYGIDVHQYLVTALAYAAGFSLWDASFIGAFSQAVDDDPEKGPFVSYDARKRYHFTTEETRNGLWSSFQSAASNKELNNGDVMESLGDFLHAQADSYSHEGFGPLLGQVPSGFRNFNLLTTTAESFYHEAEQVDVTSFDPEKAERMAKNIFDKLLEAKEIMERNGRLAPENDLFLSSLFETHAPLKYDDIKGAIMDFINAPKESEEEIQEAFQDLMEAIVEAQDPREANPDPPYR